MQKSALEETVHDAQCVVTATSPCLPITTFHTGHLSQRAHQSLPKA